MPRSINQHRDGRLQLAVQGHWCHENDHHGIGRWRLVTVPTAVTRQSGRRRWVRIVPIRLRPDLAPPLFTERFREAGAFTMVDLYLFDRVPHVRFDQIEVRGHLPDVVITALTPLDDLSLELWGERQAGASLRPLECLLLDINCWAFSRLVSVCQTGSGDRFTFERARTSEHVSGWFPKFWRGVERVACHYPGVLPDLCLHRFL
jgi:hypothetical protein